MKKIIFFPALIVFLLLAVTGCKKESPLNPEQVAKSEAENFADDDRQSACRLSGLYFNGTTYHYEFRYNANGLASQWKIHYEDNTDEVYDLEYNNQGNLKKAKYSYAGEHLINIRYIRNYRNLIVKEEWRRLDGEFYMDIQNGYDFLGRLISRESSFDTKVTFRQSFIGNAISVSAEDAGVLYQFSEYSYNKINRNPYRQVPGVTYGLPFMELDFSRWWETSEKITLNDENAVPEVVLDTDPRRTRMVFDGRYNLSAALGHDRITDEPYNTYFEYENCPGSISYKNNPEIGSQNTMKKPMVKFMTAKRISRQIALQKISTH